jgi:hypothetical protein
VGAVTVRLAGWIIVSEALSTTQELNTKLNMLTNNKLTNGCLDACIFYAQLKNIIF